MDFANPQQIVMETREAIWDGICNPKEPMTFWKIDGSPWEMEETLSKPEPSISNQTNLKNLRKSPFGHFAKPQKLGCPQIPR